MNHYTVIKGKAGDTGLFLLGGLRMKLFELGRVVITMRALDFVEENDGIHVDQLLARHQSGDWGDMDPDDKKANDRAVQTGDRILSGYQFGEDRLWILTEADRSATTILLPDDY